MNRQRIIGESGFLRFLESRGVFVFSAILLRSVLEASYVLFVSERFAYSGFYLDFSVIKYLESWVIYLGLAACFPAVLLRASDYLLTSLYAGLLAPLLVLYGYADQARFALYCMLMGSALIFVFRNGKPIRLPVIKNAQSIGIVMLFGVAVIVSLWYIASGGVAFFNLDLTKVYEFRRASADVTGGAVMSYINNWAPKVAGPTLLAYFLWKRFYLLAGAVFLLHVFWFGVSAHKSVLFYPLLVAFLWYWFSRTKALSFVFLGMTAVVGGALTIYLISDEMLLGSLFIRRVFFVVANNAFAYYEFFGSNPFVYWSGSLTSGFISYPYDVNSALLIGEWQGAGAYANSSFLSTGYMHAGVIGVALYGVIVGLLFRLIDSVARRGMPLWVGVAAIIVPSRSLILSTDLPTALLTHGVGLSILSLYLLREPQRRTAVSRNGDAEPMTQ